MDSVPLNYVEYRYYISSWDEKYKITRNGNFQYGHRQLSWISVENNIFQRGSIF